MKHLTLVILLALAPLTWGEEVWYCQPEHHGRVPVDPNPDYIDSTARDSFAAKFNQVYTKAEFKGGGFNETIYLSCSGSPSTQIVCKTDNEIVQIRFREGHFLTSLNNGFSGFVVKGTCKKF